MKFLLRCLVDYGNYLLCRVSISPLVSSTSVCYTYISEDMSRSLVRDRFSLQRRTTSRYLDHYSFSYPFSFPSLFSLSLSVSPRRRNVCTLGSLFLFLFQLFPSRSRALVLPGKTESAGSARREPRREWWAGGRAGRHPAAGNANERKE